jgi:hypothetical protein
VAESEAVEQAARELYGLPPGEFTRARDARVKELRKGGDREAADAVKALRKPTVAAWALNQLARRRAKDVERLLAAGEELRGAQEELLGGGDRSAFQEAAAAERELVAELAEDATTLASEAGERGGGLREKVAETLHAAALDEDAADALRAGRLTREREAIGGFGAPGGGLVAAPAPAEPAPKGKPKKTKSKPKSRTAGRDAEQGREDAERRREDAEQRQRLAAARTDERHARRELEAAEKAVEHAQERAEAARVHAEEAAERAKTTAERLKEAKKAETAARKAHTRAARALETAERRS